MNWQHIWTNEETGRMRCGWRVLLFLLISLVLMGLLDFFLFSQVRVAFPHTDPPAYLMMLINSLAVIPAVLAASIWAVRVLDRLPVQTLGLSFTRMWLPQIFGGLFVGIGLIGLYVLILRLAGIGELHVHWQAPVSRQLLLLGASLLALLLAAAAEELVFRGYLFQTLLRGIGPLLTLFLTAGLFALSHLNNAHLSLLGAINILVAGVLFGMLYLRMGNLWVPISLHAGWNFGQLLFNLNISGITIPFDTPLSFVLAPVPGELGRLLTGGAFGPEGSVIVSAILLAVTAVLTLSRFGLPLESFWWEWQQLAHRDKPCPPWDFTIGSRYYQWKLLVRERPE